jgi:hypothetical protein
MSTDVLWGIGVAFSGVTAFGVLGIGYLMLTVARSQARAERIGISTHMLVNSAMGAQLRLTAETARSKADLTREPVDLTAAVIAERLLREHQEKQQRADEWQGLVSGGLAQGREEHAG